MWLSLLALICVKPWLYCLFCGLYTQGLFFARITCQVLRFAFSIYHSDPPFFLVFHSGIRAYVILITPCTPSRVCLFGCFGLRVLSVGSYCLTPSYGSRFICHQETANSHDPRLFLCGFLFLVHYAETLPIPVEARRVYFFFFFPFDVARGKNCWFSASAVDWQRVAGLSLLFPTTKHFFLLFLYLYWRLFLLEFPVDFRGFFICPRPCMCCRSPQRH